MLPYFMRYDHINYAKWGVIYLAEMHQLPAEVLEEFQRGNFVVKRSGSTFNQVSPDQAQEWLNATGKKGGGIVGITKTPSALNRWALSYNHRSQIAVQTAMMFGIHDDDNLAHKESSSERKKHDNDAENALYGTLQNFGVFATEAVVGSLQNIATKDIATPEIQQSLVNAKSEGQIQLEEFVETRLVQPHEELMDGQEEDRVNFRDPIKKNSPLTFGNLYEVKTTTATSEKGKILNADRSILCRLVSAYQAGREVNLSDVLKHELMPVPVSLVQLNQTLRTGNKYVLADVLTKNVKYVSSVTLREKAALIIDGFALVAAIGKPETAKSFGEYADCFVSAVLRKGSGCSRIDVVFDRYRKHSIKASTRTRRTKKMARPVRRIIEGRNVPLPQKWQSFLALGDNKADLARFLSDELLSHAPAERTVVVAGGCLVEDDVLCSNPSVDLSVLRSNHEDADTRIVLHLVQLNGHADMVIVSARDTDVLLLLLAHHARFTTDVWLWVGTAKKPKYFSLGDVFNQLPDLSIADALLPFHAITGCDTTSFISGHSKRTAWKTFVQHFGLLASVGDRALDADIISSAEEFLCKIYGVVNDTLDLARVELFGKDNRPERLPPTSDAFKQHLKRAHYQTKIWRQAHVAKPVLPKPEEMGWRLEDGELIPVLMTLDPVPKACLEMVSCNCRTGCATLRCKCRKSGVVCTGLCGCTKADGNCCINLR